MLILTFQWFYRDSKVYTNSYKHQNIKGLWGRGSYDDYMTMAIMLIWPLKQWMVSLSCGLGKHICCLRTAGLKAVSELFPSRLYHMTHKRKRACRICGVCKCNFLGGNNLICHWKRLPLRCWKSIWTFSALRSMGMTNQNECMAEVMDSGNTDRKWLIGGRFGLISVAQ